MNLKIDAKSVYITRSARRVLLMAALFLCCLLSACGKSEDSESADADDIYEITDAIQDDSPQVLYTMTIIDVLQNQYSMDVLADVNTCPYNKALFNVSGSSASYDDISYSSRLGIDVSYHQGEIDWSQVAQAGYEFVFIRIGYRGYTEGTLTEDEMYRSYIEGATAAGLDVGVYFFSQAVSEDEAVEEADYVNELLSGYEVQLPVVFDPEKILDDTARTDDVSGEQFTENTVAFCDRIKEYGFDTMFYSNIIWEASVYDMTDLNDIPVWYADYEAVPQTPYDFEYWQFTEEGEVPGVSTAVDVDIQLLPK